MFASEEYIKHLGVLIDQNLSWKYCVLMNEKNFKVTQLHSMQFEVT